MFFSKSSGQDKYSSRWQRSNLSGFNINLILHVLNLGVKAANISLESAIEVLATSQLVFTGLLI